MALLLSLLASGQSAAPDALHLALWLWLGALSGAAVCAEAVWRNRFRLERLEADRPPGPRR